MLKFASKNTIMILFITIIIVISFESIFVDKLAVLTIFIMLVVRGAKEKTFINPYYLFSITPLSLFIYFNISDAYMLDLTHKTYILAIINMTGFIVALILTSSVKPKKNNPSLKQNSIFFLKAHAFVLLGLALLGFVITSLNAVLWLFSIAGIVCALKTKEKKMIIIVIVYILLTSLVNLSKTAILLYIITFLISTNKFYVFTKKQDFRMKLLTGLSVFFLIYSFTFANKERGNYNSDDGFSYYSNQGTDWEYSTSLFLPYMYLTTPWANLQYVTERQDTRTNGLWMIKPILSYLNFDKEFNLDSSYTLEPYSSFNTYTFVTVGFKDFGYWLSILCPIVIGFFVKKVYSRFLISQSPFDIASYIIFSLAVVEMFFSNHFYMQSYPFTMLILMWGYKTFVTKR